jgi:hypothetical protein
MLLQQAGKQHAQYVMHVGCVLAHACAYCCCACTCMRSSNNTINSKQHAKPTTAVPSNCDQLLLLL